MPISETGTSYCGILLAAGAGRRFDPNGSQNKLLQVLPNGATVVAQSANNLQQVVKLVLAIVPPNAPDLTVQLASAGIPFSKCAQAATGMAASLVHGITACQDAQGWIIALADMPFVKQQTMAQLLQALDKGAEIAIPVHQGRRGNPVAFGRSHLSRLLQLTGDQGGRALLQAYPVCEVEVDDPGIFQDIDTVSDLESIRTGARNAAIASTRT